MITQIILSYHKSMFKVKKVTWIYILSDNLTKSYKSWFIITMIIEVTKVIIDITQK